jgi:hypothetical protein
MMKSCNNWQLSYWRKYTLEVIRQEGACVKEARSNFCKYFGQQVLLNNCKCGPRRTDQFYAVLFHADLMFKHVEGQHGVKYVRIHVAHAL